MATGMRRSAAMKGGKLFESDWSTALGNGDDAVRDTSKPWPWTEARNNADMLSISTAGLDMPPSMAHCLRIRKGSAVTAPEVYIGDSQQTVNGLADMAVDETRYYRILLRVDISDAEAAVTGNAHHPIQQGPRTTFNWHFGNRQDGLLALQFWWDESDSVSTSWTVNVAYGHNFGTPPLAKFVTYRLEWAITKTGATTFTVRVRVYDNTNALVADDGTGLTNMVRSDGSGALLKNYNAVTTADRANKMPYFRTGTNGGPTYSGDQFFYLAAVMIRSDTWCGGYS